MKKYRIIEKEYAVFFSAQFNTSVYKLYFYYICICNIIPQEINIILLIEKNNNYQHSNKT